MKSRPLVGGEYRQIHDEEPTDLGFLVAQSAKRFQTPQEILEARDRLVPRYDAKAHWNELEEEHKRLAEGLEGRRTGLYDESEEGALSPEDYLGRYFLAQKRERDIPWGGKTSHLMYSNVSPEEQAAIVEHAKRIADLPSSYFEAKPQRAVGFDEFAGAVVPTGENYDKSIEALRDLGISNIVRSHRFLEKIGRAHV